MKNKFVVTIGIAVTMLFSGCSSSSSSIPDSVINANLGYSREKICLYCGNTPTKNVKGEGEYYSKYGVELCEECSSTCTDCGEAATKVGYTLSGLPIFLCDECYNNFEPF